jgi:hypothetical protein
MSNSNNEELAAIRRRMMNRYKTSAVSEKERKAFNMWMRARSRSGAKRYTKNWNRIHRELVGEFPKRFTNSRIYSGASLDRKAMRRHMKPKSYNEVLYRGLRGKNENYFKNKKVGNTVTKPSFSSFTKNKSVAKRFTHNQPNGVFLVINRPKNLPSIEFGKRGYKTYQMSENEVLLPDGKFKIKGIYNNRNGKFIHVNFTA